MKIIVFVRLYNDIDHVLPIVDYLVRKKSLYVEIYGIGEKYLECTEHIRYLKDVLHIDIVNFEENYYTRTHRSLLNISEILKLKKITISNKVVYFFAKFIASNLKVAIYSVLSKPYRKFIDTNKHDTTVMIDYGTEARFPYNSIIRSCNKHNLKVIAYLHGYYNFYNSDSIFLQQNTSKLLAKYLNKLLKGNYGKDVYFNKYLVGPHQINTFFRSPPYFGFTKYDRVVEIGIPRFTYEWGNIFVNDLSNKHCNKIHELKKYKKNINVVFFMSNAKFNVNVDILRDVVLSLAGLANINFLIKPHTRSGVSGFGYDNQTILDKISTCNSSQLIDWCDISIVYGTSIAFEVLTKGKVLVVPKFIDSNITIYEKEQVCIAVNDIYELLKVFNSEFIELKKPEQSRIDSFVKSHIYGGYNSYESLMDVFCKNIIKKDIC